ncbi:MAG: MATE family efflux transporter [Terrisporobacter sp.]
MALFNGVAQASQPIIATNYGAKEKCRVKKVFEYAMKTTILLGFLLFSIVFIFTKEVICVFSEGLIVRPIDSVEFQQ